MEKKNTLFKKLVNDTITEYITISWGLRTANNIAKK